MVNRLFLVVFMLAAFSAHAGSISFQLSLADSRLTLAGRGDSPAFFPKVFRMLPDGSWESLPPMGAIPAELAPGERVDFFWPRRPTRTPIDLMQPVMVRFYDDAGVGFGQISFFHPPLPSPETLKAAYSNGRLEISPPAKGSAILSSWLLWPREEGISAIAGPQKFDELQPPALHVLWRGKIDVDTGSAKPSAILLHETTAGCFQQLIAGEPGDNRPFWLRKHAWFFGIAATFAALSVPLLLRSAIS